MSQLIKARFCLRNMTEAEWKASSAILLKGEMGLESDTNRIKIGDGDSSWNQLDYLQFGSGSGSVENASVFNAKTHFDFPLIGSSQVIYKAEDEKKIYQWNKGNYYEELASTTVSSLDVGLIDGGNANGRK